jgi:voltage-gated sodium channel
MFVDAEAMKAKARQSMIRPQFNVTDLYWEYGCVQKIARSQGFENATFIVIMLNSIWMSIDLDFNNASIITEAHPIFYIAENVFCAYFFGEILIRFLSFKKKKSILKDRWFMFDSVLVTLMIVETWVLIVIMSVLGSSFNSFLGNFSILRMARMAKLFRMARLMRLMRAVPEIAVFLKAIKVAARSVIVVFIIWLLVIYLYGMIFRLLTKGQDIGDEYFKSVPGAMNTLLLDGILPDIAPVAHRIGAADPILWLLFLSFVLVAVVTVANMLIGVIVSVVGVVASAEKEGMTVSSFAYDLREAMRDIDHDTAAPVSKLDFKTFLTLPEVSQIVDGIGVDVLALMDTADLIFEQAQATGTITFEEFISVCLDMRGSNPATVKDIKANLKSMKTVMQEAMDNVIEQVDERIFLLHRSMNDIALAAQSTEETDDDDEDE